MIQHGIVSDAVPYAIRGVQHFVSQFIRASHSMSEACGESYHIPRIYTSPLQPTKFLDYHSQSVRGRAAAHYATSVM